jgi:hypothetical protein
VSVIYLVVVGRRQSDEAQSSFEQVADGALTTGGVGLQSDRSGTKARPFVNSDSDAGTLRGVLV